jgi:hypothetical protein
MMEKLNTWTEQAWNTLATMPAGSGEVAQLRGRWEEFKTQRTVEVVVLGAYDAGKSTLLKRLLVDWQGPVPEWLTVSGRRETFESNRVVAGELGMVDTPGLGSGSNEHDELTLGVLRLADAYVWVLPPQLVTTGMQTFMEVMCGDLGIADSTVAVIARMDEAGVDPTENRAGFIELCARKKREFEALMAAGGKSSGLRSVHCVVADPFQMVGNSRAPRSEEYDIGRSWDGVSGLAGELLGLVEQHEVLRAQAGARFVHFLLRDTSNQVLWLMEDLSRRVEDMENEVRRHSLHQQRLRAMVQQARTELHRCVEEALLSVSRSGEVGEESARRLEEVLFKTVDEWSDASFAEYRRLASELELEVAESMTSPSVGGFRRFAQEFAGRSAGEKSPSVDWEKQFKKFLSMAPALRSAFEKYAAAEIGMPLQVAAERLQELQSSGKTVAVFIKEKGRSSAFRGVEHVESASKYLRASHILDAVVPLIQPLGELVVDVGVEVMSERRAAERARQREELRSQLRKEAEKLEMHVFSDFDVLCSGLGSWLIERQALVVASRDRLQAQLRELDDVRESIDELVRSKPF